MDYVIALIVVVLLVPVIFLLSTRRAAGGGGRRSSDRGVTPDQPSSDQPTPRSGPGRDRKIPPG